MTNFLVSGASPRRGANDHTPLVTSAVAATATLASELVKVSLGRSAITPDPRDRRFQDPAWATSPVYRRLGQSYLAACAAVEHVAEELDDAGQREAAERARLLGSLVTSALAPTNTLAGNPAALKRAIDTGGASVVRGSLNALEDLRRNGGMPSQVRRDSLQVGRDLAVTPGAVIQRDEHGEVLRYAPTTEQVRERPVLIIPPPIGRFYFLDLSPGRSFVEHALGHGLQTFLLSWRNPTPEHDDWSIDDYVGRIRSAVDAVCAETGSPDVNIMGFCAGGILTSLLLAHEAATGERRVHSASFGVTMLDFGEPMALTALTPDWMAGLSRRLAERKGVRTAESTGRAFTWLRPDDLVWNYWVNNYLMGQDPPEFDILSWNADGTNLPARLYGQFIEMVRENPLLRPNGMKVLDTPVDLSEVDVPAFVMGAVADHLTPWRTTYRTTQLLGGDTVYALSSAGHIASLVNPPGRPRMSYTIAPATPGESADDWQERATTHQGSWWEAWAEWLLERSGDETPAPTWYDPRRTPPLGRAPGRYVFEKSRSKVRRKRQDGDPVTHISREGLSYTVAGSGPPLLWITGYNAPSEILAPLVEEFTDRFTCITYDLRGCGRTELPPTSISTRSMAEDALDVIESAALGPVHVLGFSLGGMIAQELALLAPDRVRALVLASSTPGGMKTEHASTPTTTVMELLRTAQRFNLWHFAPVVGTTQAWAAGTHDAAARLPQVQAPTLVVHGQEDRLLRVGHAERLAALIPDAELVTLPDAGHVFFLDGPEGMDHIATWLDEHRDQEPGTPAPPDPPRTWSEEAVHQLRVQAMPGLRVGQAFAHRAGQLASLAPRVLPRPRRGS